MILSFKKTFPWGTRTHFREKILVNEKVHTIRKDPKRRWEAGRDIHFATGVRTPNYNQFHQGVCTSVQDIQIEHGEDDRFGYSPLITIDGRVLDADEAKLFAVRDGFDEWHLLAEFFPEDFEGVLIHWTDLTY